MQYDFSRDVMEKIEKMDADTAWKMHSKIMALPEFGEIKALEGRHAGQYRLRVGEWRVIFAVEDEKVLVGYLLPPAGVAQGDEKVENDND